MNSMEDLICNLVLNGSIKLWDATILFIAFILGAVIMIIQWKINDRVGDDGNKLSKPVQKKKDDSIYLAIKIDDHKRIQIVKQIGNSTEPIECYSEIKCIQEDSVNQVIKKDDESIYVVIRIDKYRRVRTVTSRSDELEECFTNIQKHPQATCCDSRKG